MLQLALLGGSLSTPANRLHFTDFIKVHTHSQSCHFPQVASFYDNKTHVLAGSYLSTHGGCGRGEEVDTLGVDSHRDKLLVVSQKVDWIKRSLRVTHKHD